MWWCVAAALAGEPFAEVGGLFGAWVASPPRQGRLTPAFWGAPRVGMWPGARAGVEVDLGLVSGPSGLTDAGMTAFVPRVALAVDPMGPSPAPVHPRLAVGIGVDVERHRGGFNVDGAAEEDPWRSVSFVGSAGLGLDARLAGALRLRLEVAGLLLVGAPGAPDELRPGLVAGVGVVTRFGVARDGDRDRVLDRVDACPDEAEDEDGYQDDDGCRDPDNDLDGVRDELDGCDAEPEDVDRVEDDDGCPEG